ncbi:MAG: PfkB family carbohydrate kinase [Pyrinomonadaceae bacterium]
MTDLDKTITEIFPQKTVVIIGDLVADQFLQGTISRVSREAPVFILRHEQTMTVPGAAANAAVNVASLGGRTILIGVAGSDINGDKLLEALSAANVDCSAVVRDPAFSTTTKVRVLAGQHYAARQQVIRIDYENSNPIDFSVREGLRANLSTAAASADAIIVSDYNYGVVFAALYQDALTISREKGIPLIVDSRYGLANLAGATTATPNREEAEQILGKNFTSDDCSRMREKLDYQALLITNGNQGMGLFEKGHTPLELPAVGPSEPVDVTGAGDTVIAAYSLGLASGLSFADAALIANHAGGIVVMKKGTASVSTDELIASLRTAAPLSSSHDA